MGYFDTVGNVVTTSSAPASSVPQITETVVLSYMALHGDAGQLGTVFPGQGNRHSMTACAPIPWPV